MTVCPAARSLWYGDSEVWNPALGIGKVRRSVRAAVRLPLTEWRARSENPPKNSRLEPRNRSRQWQVRGKATYPTAIGRSQTGAPLCTAIRQILARREDSPGARVVPARSTPACSETPGFPDELQTANPLRLRTATLVCPAGVWSCGMKGSRRGLVTPTVAEPPGRLRKEPARKGGRQRFDRRNTNGQ